MTTNVPQPTFGPTGFIAPDEEDVLAGVLTDIQNAFGNQLNPSLATPQGQLASSMTAEIGNVNDTFVYQSTQTDPAFAQGRWQDAIGRIYFIARIPSAPTVLQIDCVGLPGVSIPVGSLLIDDAQNTYSSTDDATIPDGGSITVQFENRAPGPIPIPPTVTIYQAVPGWDAATVVSGVLGNNVESRSAFETRRALSVAQNSQGSLPSVLGAVLSVPGVIDAFVTENDLNTNQTIGGAVLSPNSLWVAVVGGDAQTIAQAIWSRKAPGCGYTGNTTVTVLDTNPAYTPPYPAYSVTFERPASLPIVFNIEIQNSPGVPSNAVTQIQNAIAGAFAGQDGGPRAKIGAEIFASRFYDPVFALGTWARAVVTLEIGSPNDADAATMTASISGTSLVVTAVTGAILIGMSVVDATGHVLGGTVILSQSSGPAGGTGTYVVNFTQTVASESMSGVNPDKFRETVLINQVPTLDPNDVFVTLV